MNKLDFYFLVAAVVGGFVAYTNMKNGLEFDNQIYNPPSREFRIMGWICFKKALVYGLTWPISVPIMFNDYVNPYFMIETFWHLHMVPCYDGGYYFQLIKKYRFADAVHAIICPKLN